MPPFIKPIPQEIDSTTPDDFRSLIISFYPEHRPKTPWIRLKGHWLAAAGFLPGKRVRVKVSFGCLVITREPELVPAAEPDSKSRPRRPRKSYDRPA